MVAGAALFGGVSSMEEALSFCGAGAGVLDAAAEEAGLPELAVASPAFQVSEAGTLKVLVLPSVEAMMVPSSSVRYTLTPFVLRVFKVSAWGWP